MSKKKKAVKKTVKLTQSPFDISNYNSDRWKNEHDFLSSNALSKTDFKAANISWQELASIYLDHESNMESLQSLANTVSQMLQQNSFVNSIRTRVKTPTALVKKIVRKRSEKAKNVTLENYKKEISDLVGVRVLHVLKNEWLPIHNSIISTFKLHKNTTPVAYITRNDEMLWKSLYVENGCRCETNDRDYKSVHYDIEIGFTKEFTLLEIQVRTINEEAWGELDHKINYPTPAIKVVGDFIKAANMLSSTADQLSQHIILVNSELSKMQETQEKLKSEKNTALKETRELVSRLAKTKQDKARAEKALNDLESSMGPQFITTISGHKVTYNHVEPLSLNVNSPSVAIKNNSNIFTLDESLHRPTTVSHISTSKCKHCNKPNESFLATQTCNDCAMKGLI